MMHAAVQVCDLSVLSTYASSVQVVPAILEPADAPGPSALSVSHSVLTIMMHSLRDHRPRVTRMLGEHL